LAPSFASLGETTITSYKLELKKHQEYLKLHLALESFSGEVFKKKVARTSPNHPLFILPPKDKN
jgi:hypothetical protein